jgi:hypothetical protein
VFGAGDHLAMFSDASIFIAAGDGGVRRPAIPDPHGFVDEFTFVAWDAQGHSASHAA